VVSWLKERRGWGSRLEQRVVNLVAFWMADRMRVTSVIGGTERLEESGDMS
jgi:hypothetical protein